MIRTVNIIKIIALALLVAALLSIKVKAHEWYDPACCNDRDCAPIPMDAVRITAEGYLVEIGPGEHPMLHGEVVFSTIPFNSPMVRKSQDGDYHACLTAARSIRCFYVPAMTM